MRATNHPPRRSSSLLAARDVGSLAVVTIREGRRGWIEMDIYAYIYIYVEQEHAGMKGRVKTWDDEEEGKKRVMVGS